MEIRKNDYYKLHNHNPIMRKHFLINFNFLIIKFTLLFDAVIAKLIFDECQLINGYL